MTGQGYVAVDVALFMLICGAASVHAILLPSWHRTSPLLGLSRVLRMTGWVLLGARFGAVLFTTGDVLISMPAAIAIGFLACGDIAVIFCRGKVIQL